MFHKFVLPNKIRLIVTPLSGTQAVTTLILVGAGSRYEEATTNGISHFLEHMFFKGSKKYPTPKDVSVTIDGIGGDFNAFTGKEYTGYYIKCAKDYLKLSLDLLSDLLIRPRFLDDAIERERGVILEEINMYEDMPSSKAENDFEELMYGDQPLGWDIARQKAVIKKLQRADFQRYKKKLYTPDNIVISIAGNVSVDEVRKLVTDYFRREKGKKALTWPPLNSRKQTGRLSLRNKKTEQAHCILGVPGLSGSDPRKHTAQVLATILGGNMSSRMFMTVRENQGLCYSIYTSSESYLDAGHLDTAAGVDISRTTQALRSIIREYEKITEKNVSAKELKKAKDFMKGRLVLQLEDSDEVALFFGRQELLRKDILTPTDVKKRIDAVTADQVKSLARQLFMPSAYRLTVVGPYPDRKPFESLLKKS